MNGKDRWRFNRNRNVRDHNNYHMDVYGREKYHQNGGGNCLDYGCGR